MRPVVLLLMLVLAAPALAQDWALRKLEKSPRHLEWVQVKHGNRTVKSFLAFPEKSAPAPGVVVIHEIFGLTDWARTVADELAARGYVALAPDLLSGSAPGGGGTAELGGDDAARKAIGELPPEQVTADLKAAVQYLRGLPGCNGKVAVGGFCWGGMQTFRFATNAPDIQAAYVFYGNAPDDPAALARIQAPVYGFYAQNDARINDTLGATVERMAGAGRFYRPLIYAGAGHGFMRAGEAPDANVPNRLAREQAWERWEELLKRL